MNKRFLSIIAVTGALAVIIGAFGAHGLKPKLTADHLATYNTGVQYHFYHLLGLCFIALQYQMNPQKILKRGFYLMLVGIIFFSGSLYLLSAREVIGLSTYKWLVPITPIGGVCFILGWLSLLLYALKKDN